MGLIAALRRLAQGRAQEGADEVVPARPPDRLPDAGRRRGQRHPLCRGQRRDPRRHSISRPARSCGSKKLGTLQKGSPVLADGKLYVGTENGQFYILKPVARPASKCSTKTRCRSRSRRARRRRAGARADRRLAGRRQRPRLRRLDGRALRDRAEGAEGGARGPSRHDRGARGGRSGRRRARVSVRRHAEAGPGAEVHGQPVRRQGQSSRDDPPARRSPGRSKA